MIRSCPALSSDIPGTRAAADTVHTSSWRFRCHRALVIKVLFGMCVCILNESLFTYFPSGCTYIMLSYSETPCYYCWLDHYL